MLNGIDVSNEKKQKTEAFICLLSHYQIFIGKVIGLFKPSCEQYLMKRSFFRWDKTGCCTSLNSSASGANVIPGTPSLLYDVSCSSDAHSLQAIRRNQALDP